MTRRTPTRILSRAHGTLTTRFSSQDLHDHHQPRASLASPRLVDLRAYLHRPRASTKRRRSRPASPRRTAGMERRDGFLPIYLDRQPGSHPARDSPRLDAGAPDDLPRRPDSVRIRSGSIAAPVERHTSPGSTATATASSSCSRTGRIASSSGNAGPRADGRRGVPAEHGGGRCRCWRTRTAGCWSTRPTSRFATGTTSPARSRRSSRGRTPSRATDRACTGRTPRPFPTTPRSTSRSRSRRPAGPGGIVESIVPDGRAFTLRQHLSFLKLPDDGFQPRAHDPRVGYLRHHVQGLRAADPGTAGGALGGAASARARRTRTIRTRRSRSRFATTSTAEFPSRFARRRSRA